MLGHVNNMEAESSDITEVLFVSVHLWYGTYLIIKAGYQRRERERESCLMVFSLWSLTDKFPLACMSLYLTLFVVPEAFKWNNYSLDILNLLISDLAKYVYSLFTTLTNEVFMTSFYDFEIALNITIASVLSIHISIKYILITSNMHLLLSNIAARSSEFHHDCAH